MTDPDFQIRHFHLHIPDLDDGQFLVAKIRRVTSAPAMSNSTRASLCRLADIFRLGTESRNYADLCTIDWLLQEQFHTNAQAEWANYEKAICRVLGVEQLNPIARIVPPWPTNRHVSDMAVAYHEAEMNNLPYLVAKVGSIMGSPAPLLLTLPNEEESALARLRDVFRIGLDGQVFKDFAEQGLKLGRSEQEILGEWRHCERVVLF